MDLYMQMVFCTDACIYVDIDIDMDIHLDIHVDVTENNIVRFYI